MFEIRRLYCEYAELHAPSSSGLDELLIICRTILVNYLAHELPHPSQIA